MHCPLNLVFLHVGIANALADGCSCPISFDAGHRIGAIVGGVEGARPVISGKADSAEGGIGWSAVGRLGPVDHARADIRPELVVQLRPASDEAGGKSEPSIVGLIDCSVEILD